MKKTILFITLSLGLHGLLYAGVSTQQSWTKADTFMEFVIRTNDMKLKSEEQTFYFTRELPDGTEVWCTKSAFVHEEGKDWQRTFCAFYTLMNKS